MRIAVMGAGGVGGYFGARLGEAGHDVAFIARGRHLAAMRERGLAVRSTLGDIRLPRPAVTDDPASLAPADVVLLGGEALGYGERGGGGPSAPRERRRRHPVPEWRREHRADRRRRRRGPRAGRRCVHRGDDRRTGRHRAHGDHGAIALRPGARRAAARCRGVARGVQERGHRGRALGRHPPRAVGEVRVPGGLLRLDERRPAADGRPARRSRSACGARGGDHARRGRSAAPKASRSPTTSSPSR